ncbi:MAG: NUDIX domain-containing protein [Eubacteriales bacterium]|nr:NUDIX domain-containing protein [Eubacteriales bacterium]
MAWPTHIVAAAGYVLDGKGNMLLIRTPHRGWDCTGGQVEVGEDVVSGVLREIMEESGVHARVIAWWACMPMWACIWPGTV